MSLLHSFVAARLYSTVTARLLGFAATDLLVRQHVLMVCEVQMDFCTFTALPNTPSRKLPLRISAGVCSADNTIEAKVKAFRGH